MKLFSYHIEKKPFRTADYLFSYLTGQKERANNLTWIKVCNPGERYRSARKLLLNEAKILESIPAGICPKCYGYVEKDAHEGLIFQAQQGTFLSELPLAGKLEARQVIKIGLQILKVLQTLHQAQILHLSLHPGNIIWDPNTGKVTLWDLTHAHPTLPSAANREAIPQAIDLNPWMAPEQTGKLNQQLDLRTDLYGVGATLYFLLTGKPLIKEKDPLKLIHHILASPAPRLSESGHPPALSRVVSRLLEKHPDKRYQSIQGVRWDLEQLLAVPDLFQTNTDFIIGQHDKKQVFQLPDHFQGRSHELSTMTEAYSWAQEGGVKLLLLEGPSGVGKSALWDAFVEGRDPEEGFFVRGRFEEFNQDIPYQGWMDAFGVLLRHLLTKDEKDLEGWRSKIEEVVGGNLDLFRESLPELQLFIEDTKPTEELPPVYMKSRFQLIIKELIKIFCCPGMPLVLFLDDMQWAKTPSIDLISVILEDPSINHLFIVAGCGADGTGEQVDLFSRLHPYTTKPEQILKLDLKPFGLNNIVNWIKDFLEPTSCDIQELATIALKKTSGNPFYLKSWFSSLFHANKIQWDTTLLSWSWDTHEVSQANLPEDMTDLIMANVRQLPPETLDVLKIASCLGLTFTPEFPAKLMKESLTDLSKRLSPAIKQNIIQGIPEENHPSSTFQFAHEKIQSTLYRGLSEAYRSQCHSKAALWFIEKMSSGEEEQDLFTIAYHLINGQASAIPEEHRIPAANLLIQVGRRAMRTGSFLQALNFFHKAEELVKAADWQHHFDALFELYTGMGECQFILGDQIKANIHFERAMEATTDPYTKARVLYLQMGLYNYFEDLAEGHKKALQGLRLLGQSYTNKASIFLVVRKLSSILLRFSPKKAEQLLRSPRRASKEKALAINFLIEMSAFNYEENPTYSFLPILEILNLTLRHGLAEGSPFAIAALGGVHLLFLNAPEKAQRLWETALKILDKYPSRSQLGRVQFIIYGTIKNVMIPVRDCLPELNKNYQTSLREGDIYWAYSSLIHSCYFMLNIGHRLSDIAEYIDQRIKAHFPKQESQTRFHLINLQMLEAYVGALHRSGTILPIADKHLDRLTELNNKASIFLYHFLNTALAYYSGNPKKALDNAERAAAFLPWAQANSMFQDFLLLHALILSDTARTEASISQKKIRKTLRQYHRQMKGYAQKGPANFKAKERIIRGLLQYEKGHKAKAVETWINAKFIAQEHGIIPDAAIAAEWAGKIKLEMGERISAARLIQEAHSFYMRWENIQAAQRLLAWYPGLIFGQLINQDNSFSEHSPDEIKVSASDSPLNLATIEKISMALAAERRQGPLLEKFLTLIMENAGASSAAYFSSHSGTLQLEASTAINRSYQRQQQPLALETLNNFPKKIIRFVARTREYLVLDHPATDPRFSEQAFSQEDPPLSILCYPLTHGGRLQGILYAENKFIPGAFARENLQLLKLVSGQMSLSIENAQAHELLEAKVHERTIALHQEQKRSEKLLLNILPKQVADELKEKNKATPRYYAETTVLFTDFVNFTRYAEGLSPQQLVSLLDEYFSAFDEICSRHGIEKIKTIGDAFLCVGGLPIPSQDHAEKVIRAALDMMKLVREKQQSVKTSTGVAFDIRIGIHTGPLVAGVVGINKFSYDIWGDTVNTAYRLEAKSAPGRINISADTYQLIADSFACEYRGKFEVKGKGSMDMYFVGDRL